MRRNGSQDGFVVDAVAPAIELRHVRKAYDGVAAVKDVSLTVARGEVFGLVGPNGAGKTTTVECIEGLREPDGGSIRVLGIEPAGNRLRLFRHVGVQLQEGTLHPRVRCLEALRLFASFHPSPVDGDDLLKAFGLENRKRTFFGDLSAGQKRRLMVAVALIGDPDLLILDEPTTGLDPQARYNFWSYLRTACASGKTVLLTTHYLEEAEEYCDEIALMDHGEILLRGRPQEILRERGLETRITIEDADGWARAWIERHPDVRQVEVVGSRLVVYGARDPLRRIFASEGAPAPLEVRGATLQDLFLLTTGREYREE
jgi:ABC-2 type transport system ATP-binding protein